jgi:hypothetical protein
VVILIAYGGALDDGGHLLPPTAGRSGEPAALHRVSKHRRKLQPAGAAQLIEVELLMGPE